MELNVNRGRGDKKGNPAGRRVFSVWVFLAVCLLAGCGKAPEDSPKTLKVAMARISVETRKIWEAAGLEYERRHPGVRIEYLGMDSRHYETSGLTSMLLYDNPDIYFEWGGERVAERKNQGHAADLTEVLKKGDWHRSFFKASWDGLVVDGRVYMVPYSTQVSSVFWFNKTMFNSLNLAPPSNWGEFERVCEKLKEGGILPVYLGNRDLWPGGNIMGHLVSRIVGEEAYHKALIGERSFNRPDFQEAFGYIQRFRDRGYINRDVSGVGADEGISGWIRGKGAMLPLGSWVVEAAVEQAPGNFEYDFFNLPAVDGKKGDQTSILGLNVGFIVNAKSRNFSEAVGFLRFLTSPEIAAGFAKGGVMIAVKGVVKGVMLEKTRKLTELLNTTPTIVAPPDTGYNLDRADAFYQAVSKVLGGVSTPRAALAELDLKLAGIPQ